MRTAQSGRGTKIWVKHRGGITQKFVGNFFADNLLSNTTERFRERDALVFLKVSGIEKLYTQKGITILVEFFCHNPAFDFRKILNFLPGIRCS